MSKKIDQAKQKAVRALLRPDSPGNVVAIGIGTKSGADCLRVYVVRKLAPNRLSEKALVKEDYLGVPTHVIEMEGPLGRKGYEPWAKPALTPGPGSRIRVKTSAPNVNSGAIGTLAAVVDCAGQRYILGCNHILAVNGRVRGKYEAQEGEAEKGDAEIVSAVRVGKEPAIADPGPFVLLERDRNLADCALAKIKKRKRKEVLTTFPMENLEPDPMEPACRMKVEKFGAATGLTTGNIVDTRTDLYVDTSFGRFRFKDQIVIDGGKGQEFATEGDSGSIVWGQESKRQSKRPVGMIFAAAGRYAIACPLLTVWEKLKEKTKSDLKLLI
jgi:hypothetical protein